MSPLGESIPLSIIVSIWIIPAFYIGKFFYSLASKLLIEVVRQTESVKQNGKLISGYPPKRDAYSKALVDTQKEQKGVINKYLLGFNSFDGEPIWLSDQAICSNGYILSYSNVTNLKTAWLESLILQQFSRGRVSGCTFIDKKHNSETLSHIIFIAMITGRIEDVIIIDPTNSLHSYNFLATNQSAEIKSKKILKIVSLFLQQGFINPHLNRLVYDTISRIIRALENTNKSWSIKDLAKVLSDFESTYPTLKEILHEQNAWKCINELEEILLRIFKVKDVHYRHTNILEAIKRVASVLESLPVGELSSIISTPYTDLNFKEAVTSGKIIYFYLPHGSEQIFTKNLQHIICSDLECAISEIVETTTFELDDPHIILVDDHSSSIHSEWLKLCDNTKNSKFSFIFGAVIDASNDYSGDYLVEKFQKLLSGHVHFKITLDDQDYSSSSQRHGFTHSQLWPQALLQFNNDQVIQFNPLLFKAILPYGWSGREFISSFNHISRDELRL
jgi:hypothetical protein